MTARPTLYHQLQRYILPRLLTALSVISVILCLCIFYVAKNQIKAEQQTNLQYLKQDLMITLDNTQQLMEGIAANDLLINSLIDIQQRKNYLPVFFGSLRFTRAKVYSLGLFEFDGTLLIETHSNRPMPASMANSWQETVLQQSNSYRQITEDGVLIAVPVLIAGAAEGALALYIPSFQELIYERDTTAYQLIVDSQGKILFSSHPDFFKVNTHFDQQKYEYWTSQETEWQGLTLISQAPALDAYSNVLWLIPAILITLSMAIVISYYATNRAARLSASTLRGLHDDIQQSATRRQPQSAEDRIEEAQELAEIREAFNALVNNISSITLSNRQFSNAIDSLEEILVVLDSDSNKILANRAFNQYILYYDLNESQIVSVKNRLSGNTKSLQRTYASLSEKAPVIINWTALPLLDDNRMQVGTILVGNDVSKQRVLEKRINVINHAIKAATVPILIADAKKKGFPVIYANPHFSRVTGFKEDETLHHTFLLMRELEAEPEKADKIKTALQQGTACDETLLCYRKNKTPLYIQVILTPVFNEGELEHFVAFFQDVTEREQGQQFLEEARLRAEESARLKSSFLASMSHEVRTPLHGVSGALQLVSKTALDKTQQHYVGLADESIRNLQHIVDDILDFSKIEAGQLKLENVPYNLPLLLETLYEQFSISSDEKGLQLNLDTELAEHVMVQGDPVRLRQVLSNLLSNAVKFTQNGSILLSVSLVETSSEQWQLQGFVQDSGIGIDEGNLDSIFEVFQQEDTSTTRKFGGTGLGLSISRQLCRLMQGDLTVQSRKDEGSKFLFTVAVSRPAYEAYIAAPDTTKHSEPEATLQPSRILIVEDNEINQLIAREHLSEHKTLTAKNGVEALEALKRLKVQFDVILMDCHMPKMDGFETTRRIRAGEAGERYTEVPIIALTANAMKGDRERCEAAGMDDYISKPFTAKQLLKAVSNARYKKGQ